MMNPRTPEQRFSDEAKRWRLHYRAAQSALHDANRMLLGVYLRERLADPSDFAVYVDLATVTDHDGRLRWDRIAVLVDELLDAKPHLATPDSGNPATRARSALSSLLAET